MGSLSAKNASEKFSRLGTFKADFSGEEILVPFFSQIRKRQGGRKYRGGDSQGGKIADIDDRN